MRGVVAIPSTSLAAGTPTTLLLAQTSISKRCKIIRVSISQASAWSSSGPISVQFARASTAGSYGSNITAMPFDDDVTEAFATVWRSGYSGGGEPSYGSPSFEALLTVLGAREWPPPCFPGAPEPFIGLVPSSWWGIQATSPAAAEVTGFLEFEE